MFFYQGGTSAPEDEEALAIGFLVQILSLLVTRDLGNVAAVKVKEAVYLLFRVQIETRNKRSLMEMFSFSFVFVFG